MQPVTLTQTTGYELADTVLQKIVSRFEAAFPNQIIGYYVSGSYADQSAVVTSDLDLEIIFRRPYAAKATGKIAQQLVTELARESPVELDIGLITEAFLVEVASPTFKLGAQLVYGQEIRESIPLIPIIIWARNRMHAAHWLTINVFGRPHPVCVPLTFPEPDIPFYGYTNRKMQLADGTEISTTRNLVRVTGWIATARLAHEAQVYVAHKRDCYPTYARVINDEWTPLLERIDQRCRTTWHYRIPDNRAEQQELQAILEETLAFENHFMSVYRHFLLAELGSSDPVAQCGALQFLGKTFYVDAEVTQAVQQLMASHDSEVQDAANNLSPQLTKASLAI